LSLLGVLCVHERPRRGRCIERGPIPPFIQHLEAASKRGVS
jgi:hypothetical protein